MAGSCDVSVLLTSCNQTELLPVVLQRFAAQDYRGSWEIIVCDDGSEEDALEIIRHAPAPLASLVRYVWQPRGGERRARNRNNGLRCAKGRIVIFVDGDIAVRPDFVTRHVEAHMGEPTIVFGPRFWLFLGDLPAGYLVHPAIDSLLGDTADKSLLVSDLPYQEYHVSSSCPWLGCLGFNFSFVPSSREVLFDEDFVGWGCEDQEFACRLSVRHGYRLHFSRLIDTVHLEAGFRKDYVPLRPQTSSDISLYVKNLVHFCNSYPEFDAVVICYSLGLFEFDHEKRVWNRARRPRSDRQHIRSLLATARECLG